MELHIRGVSKTYANGVQALKGVTLTIPVGMYGLLGPNGSGKSTLMRTIATLQEPDEGSIRFGPSTLRELEGRPEQSRGAAGSGRDIDVLHQKDEVRKTLGYLPQEFGLYPKVSAEPCSITSRCSKALPGAGRARRSSRRSFGRRTCGRYAGRSWAATRVACGSASASPWPFWATRR